MPVIPHRWRRSLAGTLLAACALAPLAYAQSPLPEPQLKAAFMLNFIRYIEWPEKAFSSRDAPIVVCLLGRDTGAVALASLDGRKAQDRLLKVRIEVNADSARGCHAVFIADSELRRLRATLRSFAGQPVLTVGDSEGFIDSGGAIGMVQGEQRLQFEINRNALDQAQLKASSQLLKLARVVLSPGS